ncbi:MAG: hypothetical protein JWR74_1922 [Polaromonas sp.]|nr:hypothetical protein [Polaromonas sp.]
MALITPSSNVKVTLDETSGLQNASATPLTSADADDNDILLSAATFPSVFQVLSAFGTVTKTALSGYTGAAGNTGSNAFTLSPGTGGAITDVSFVGPDGQPLAGLDSGLLTLDGTRIFLYTDTNNNVVLGRVGNDGGTASIPGDDTANASGAIAFAGYIEETLTGTAITGGKIWLTQYQALRHPDPADADDSVSLLNKVFVGVSQDTEFSLAGAPSGQNLFLMFSKANPNVDASDRITDVSIIATGKDPLNQSNGGNISSGDTINTSQAGGPTTFGTNSQMITELEGIRYTFVTGARQNVTIPNLDQNEADVEANIDFTAFFGTRTAQLDVVQLQSGKTAQVLLTASSSTYANSAGDPHQNESGAGFIDGYADDATVAINKVSVTSTATGAVIASATGTTTTPNNGIVFTFTGGVVLVTGVKAGYTIEYTTASDHNRVLVQNGAALNASGNTHADFDIGGFKVLQTSVDKIEIGSTMVFEDDGPSVAVSQAGAADAVAVDETNLALNASADFSDNYASTASYGADGAGTVSSVYALGVSVPGADSGLDDVATGANVLLYLDAAGAVVGRAGSETGAIVFTVSVSAAGVVSLDQQRALVHPNAGNPDDAVSPVGTNLITLTRTDTITDKDGDSNTGDAAIDITAALSFKDDGPGVSANAAVQLDDDALANGIAGGTDDDANATNTSGTLGHAYGADGAGSVALLTTAALPTGFSYDALSTSTTLLINQGVTRVLTVTLTNAATGAYSVTQNAAILHAAGSDENNAVFTVGYRVTDKDGDTALGTLGINVDDDTPTATGTAATGTVDEDGLANGIAGGTGDATGEATTVSGTVSGIFQSGADSPLSYGVSGVTTALPSLSSGGTALAYSVLGNTLSAKAGTVPVFTFAITDTATGAYTFTLFKPLDHAAGNGENDITINLGTVVQATDKDGDTVTAAADKVAITVDDDSPNLAFGNLVGTGTDLAQYGFWSKAAGADGPNADDLQVTLTGFQLGGVAQAAANFSLTEQAPSPDANGSYNFSGSLKGDFDNNAATADTTVSFTLAALANGKYALDLAAPITSSTTTDTASGALGAGGPDPVQTLFIPSTAASPAETVVFFSAKVGATVADIAAGIIQGQADPTEASLQGPPLASFIDPQNMNVSTSGIGVANNVLEGDANAAIGGAGSTDESFVVNPGALVNTVRVFVDNSVSGYKYTPGPGSGGNERLYYTAYYSDGGNSGPVLVNYDINTGAGTPKFFEVGGGTRLIDAVQLTMARGDVKIPNIQFVTTTESLAKDIGLDFTASLTDWDGDTVSSAFSADLFTNKAATATFDYELLGSLLAKDAFDIDLQSVRNDYRITGFDTTSGARDQIVLLGDANAVVGSIDNSSADSIVTITESLQATTLTVIGVDLLAADIVFA